MSAPRLLWTGPYAADLRGRAIDKFDADALWIVATPMARDQLASALIRKENGPKSPQVYSWTGLWEEVARRHPRPPTLLSEAALRAALVAAIDLTGDRDELGPLVRVVGLPGTRRALCRRFAAWTRSERNLDDGPPRDDPITRAEWSIFRRYRKRLVDHRAVDATGLAVWASKAFRSKTFGDPGSIVFLDPIAPSKAQLRLIASIIDGSSGVVVTLPTSGDPSGDDPAISVLRSSLIEAGFDDESFEPETSTGLAIIESSLFQDFPDLPKPGPAAGLSILQGPQGEGLGLLIAREARRCLDGGVAPDDLLVLVRHWDDDAARTLEILRDRGIPASGSGRRPLGAESGIAALRLAISVTAGGWESSTLIRLLRNGRIGIADPLARAEAASVILSVRTFRGLDRIRAALDRGAMPGSRDVPRMLRARSVFDQIAAAIEPVHGDEPWPVHVDRLRESAEALGIGDLDSLWDALDDHALIRDFAAPSISHATFVRDVESILVDLDAPRPAPRPGTVRVMTVDEAEGTSARVILLTNLAEGTFPTRAAVAPSPDENDGLEGESLPFARERLQFLHAIGAARDEAILLVPTTDPKGQDLLPAGFIDDLRRLLHKRRGGTRVEILPRLDPTFLGHPDLAGSPAEATVLAVATACLNGDGGALETLCRDPERRPVLSGLAAALRLVHERLRIKQFTSFDGILSDDRLIAQIVERFGPDHCFSPSQFESFALCPFQFYQKYVLKLAPVDDRPELRTDRGQHGVQVHKALEEIHLAIQAEGGDIDDLGKVQAFIETRMTVDLDVGDDGPGEVADGLRAIEDGLVRKGLKSYLAEFLKYRGKIGASALPRHFEVRFGPDDCRFPELDLGENDAMVRLRGMIDRVDLLGTGDGSAFRVIDYKTGPIPAVKDVVDTLRAVQLPLYAMAVERFLFSDQSVSCDFGYWAVGNDGFKPIDLKKESWINLRERVVGEVLQLAANLRRGAFPVDPTKADCTRTCDYKTTCRIGQIRNVGKEVVTISMTS